MSSLGPNGERVFWRSLEDLEDTPEFRVFAENEFPFHPGAMPDPGRRDFLKVMGASMALAGVTACRWPSEEIVPFAHRPEGYVPGVPARFATAMEIGGVATGLLATSYDGRPIKIEGNPLHPGSQGGTDALAQAAVLELYDPERSRGPVRYDRGQPTAVRWEEFLEFAGGLSRETKSRAGEGFRVLAEPTSSPTVEAMRARLLSEFPRMVWHEWEPFNRDAERIGTRLAFGRSLRPHLALDQAQCIVSLDADLLGTHPVSVRHVRDFAAARRADDGRMSRLWVVEASYSLTGAAADQRVAVPSLRIPAIGARLAAELFLKHGVNLPPGAESLRAALERWLALPTIPSLEAMAGDLASAGGRGLVAAGDAQPPELHALAHLMNLALGAAGRVVRFTSETGAVDSCLESMRGLAADMASGKVETLLVLGGNPVFDAPADLEFEASLGSVRNAIHLSPYRDETSRACRWHLNRAHFLESWGDTRGWDGTVSIVQPLIEPLWGGRTSIEVLAILLGEASPKGHSLVRETFSAAGGPDLDRSWRKALHDGVVPGSARSAERPVAVTPGWADGMGALFAEGADPSAMEVVFRRDPKIHDGRFANNAWLQELPDPLTRIAWDNAALLAPSTARQLGVQQGDLVRIRCEDRTLDLPAFPMPGQAHGVVAIAPGYGRRAAGRVGNGVGFDGYRLRTSSTLHAARCRVEAIPGRHLLATTQDHHVIDRIGIEERGRRAGLLVREADLGRYVEEPDFARKEDDERKKVGLWREQEYEGHRWGLSIDLNGCVGCGACTVACQAENNIPVVGKAEVANGREMHWIRVDRYFKGTADEPSVAFQPMACHQCENAPCEQVCPVGATMHDREGLNVMVYNRCVGTRYCSNNCPYKVRRFNWFNNHKSPSAVEMMVFNPEVSLRGRGVMEKCTFCVQRISAAKIDAKNAGRDLRDGDVVTACQQACPASAIVFGDLNDPKSEIRRLHDHPRSYGVLEDLNVKPRLRYMARLRNPHGRSEGTGEGRA